MTPGPVALFPETKKIFPHLPFYFSTEKC